MEDSGQLDIALYHLKAAAAKAKLTAKAIQHTVQEWPHLYPLLQIHPLFAIVPTSKVHGIRKRLSDEQDKALSRLADGAQVFLSQLEHSATQLNQQYAAVLKTLEGQMESAFRDIHAEESQQLDALRSEIDTLTLDIARLDAEAEAARAAAAALAADLECQATVTLGGGNIGGGSDGSAASTLALSPDLIAAQELDNAQAAAEVRALRTEVKELEIELSDARMLLEHAQSFKGHLDAAVRELQHQEHKKARQREAEEAAAAQARAQEFEAAASRARRSRKSVVMTFAQLQLEHGSTAGLAPDLLPAAAAAAAAAAASSGAVAGTGAGTGENMGPRNKRARLPTQGSRHVSCEKEEEEEEEEGGGGAANAAGRANNTASDAEDDSDAEPLGTGPDGTVTEADLAAALERIAALEVAANQAAAEYHLLTPTPAPGAGAGAGVGDGAADLSVDLSLAAPDSSILADIAPLLRSVRPPARTTARTGGSGGGGGAAGADTDSEHIRAAARARRDRAAAELALEGALRARLAADAAAEHAAAGAAALVTTLADTVAAAVSAGAVGAPATAAVDTGRVRAVTERLLKWLLRVPTEVEDTAAEAAATGVDDDDSLLSVAAAASAGARRTLSQRCGDLAAARMACGVIVDVAAGLRAEVMPFSLISRPAGAGAGAVAVAEESDDARAFTQALRVLCEVGAVKVDEAANTVALVLPAA